MKRRRRSGSGARGGSGDRDGAVKVVPAAAAKVVPAGAGAAAGPAVAGPPTLLSLPDPLLLRVLACLPAEDLLTAARGCRRLALLASDNGLWRRHFLHRWADREDETGPDHGSPGWKVGLL